MKNTFLILALSFFSLSVFSQIDKKQNLKISTFKLDYSFLDLENISFNYSKIKIADSKNTLYIYNKDLNLNDVYVYNNNTLNYTSSKQTFSLNRTVNYNFKTYKADSFNPYGASNFKEAVLFGLINTLFK